MTHPYDAQPFHEENGQQHLDAASQYSGSQPQYPGQQHYFPSGQPYDIGQPSSLYYQESPKPNNSGKWWALGSGIVVVLVAIVATTTVILLNKDSSDDSNGNSSHSSHNISTDTISTDTISTDTTTTSSDVTTVDPEEFAKQYTRGPLYVNGRFVINTPMICPNSPEMDSFESSSSMKTSLSSRGVVLRTAMFTVLDSKTTSSTADSAEVIITGRVTIFFTINGANTSTSSQQKQRLSLKKRGSSWCVYSSSDAGAETRT